MLWAGPWGASSGCGCRGCRWTLDNASKTPLSIQRMKPNALGLESSVPSESTTWTSSPHSCGERAGGDEQGVEQCASSGQRNGGRSCRNCSHLVTVHGLKLSSPNRCRV